MTLDEIKEAVTNMSKKRQDELAAYLAFLRHLREPVTPEELARKIDDRDPSHWISLDQLRDRWKD